MMMSLHLPRYPLSLTLTVPPVWQQLVAAWARAVVRAWDVDTLVDAQLPSLVQPVHLTLIYICEEITGSVDVCLIYASQDRAEEVKVCDIMAQYILSKERTLLLSHRLLPALD